MQSQRKILTILRLTFFFIVVKSSERQLPPGEKISLSVPHLSEEEIRSNHVPDHLKCDACLGISHRIIQGFHIAEDKQGHKLRESEIIDVLENTCETGFGEYGIKKVNDINRLSGPGLETEKVMGMTQMGGRWPFRLKEMCHAYVGEAGEMEIYKAFKSGFRAVHSLLCYGTGVLGHCLIKKHVGEL